eukprot:jgi/Chlat1/7626/Chrsp64S07102
MAASSPPPSASAAAAGGHGHSGKVRLGDVFSSLRNKAEQTAAELPGRFKQWQQQVSTQAQKVKVGLPKVDVQVAVDLFGPASEQIKTVYKKVEPQVKTAAPYAATALSVHVLTRLRQGMRWRKAEEQYKTDIHRLRKEKSELLMRLRQPQMYGARPQTSISNDQDGVDESGNMHWGMQQYPQMDYMTLQSVMQAVSTAAMAASAAATAASAAAAAVSAQNNNSNNSTKPL